MEQTSRSNSRDRGVNVYGAGIGSFAILQYTLSAVENYTIDDYIPGFMTVLAPKASVPASVYSSLSNIAAGNMTDSSNLGVLSALGANTLITSYTEALGADFTLSASDRDEAPITDGTSKTVILGETSKANTKSEATRINTDSIPDVIVSSIETKG